MTRGLFATFVAAVALFGGFSTLSVESASAHRSGCHRWHTCPSDHATYSWRQPSTGRRLLCVAPYADERNSTFRTRVVYAGRTYWCKR